MDAFNSLNVLPIYTSVAYQNSNKWYAFGNIWPLVSPTNSLLPFQFVVPYNITSASEVRIKDSNSGETYQSGITPEIDSSMYGSSGYSVIKVKEQTFSSLTLEEGRYYLEISISDGSGTYSFVSDIFTAVSDLSKYIKIEYWNDENLYYKGGEISYTNDFKFIMYVCSSIGKPEYEFEEELTERAGYKFLESQISNKLYKFTFVAPEFICDAMRLIRMSDYIVITSLGKKFNALTFSYEPEWEEQGDLASVEVEFTIDSIIQKLASFNRRQKQDFYNALLANEVEALKFDDESVAQYYKDFQQTYSGTNFIDGKLIRELDELTSLPEGKAYIAIDIGVGAARKIDISAILNLSDGSLYDKFISKEKPDGTNFLFNVGEYVDSIKDGKGIGLHPGGRAQLSILEARKQIQIGEAILFWDDVNKAIGIKRVAVPASEDGAGEIKESEIGVYSQGWMSAKGMDKGSESGGTGATTLGGLTNVGSWADQTASYDRILVQLSGSKMWTEKKLSEIGGGLDEEQLATYLTENNYAKTSDIPSLEGYATETWVTDKGYITSAALTGYATQSWVLGKNYATISDLDARIDALVNGAPAAYDTLKEIADVLQGNVDSIGDIITTLGTKADKTITITAGTGLTGGGDLSLNRTISLKPAKTTALGGIIVGERLSIDASGVLSATYTYTHPSATATTISAATGKVLSAITVNNLGHVTSVAAKTLAAADIPTLSISKISGLQDELDSKLEANVFNDLFEKVEIRSGVYAIRAKYGLYSNEFISAKGMDEGEGGGGEGGGGSGSSYLSDLLDVSLTSLAANDLLKWNGTRWVNVPQSSIVPSLAWDNITGKPSWIGRTKPTYTFSEITSKPTTVKGYGITDAVTINDDQEIKSDKKWASTSSDVVIGFSSSGSPIVKHVIHTTAGWARGYSFDNSNTDVYCIFGAYGQGENLLYQYVGIDYKSPWQKWNGTRSDLSVPLYVNNYEVWHKGNVGSGSGLNADLLDGVHKEGLFTNLGSSTITKLSITIGGTTKSLTSLYASHADTVRVTACNNGVNQGLWDEIKTSTRNGTLNVYDIYNNGGPTAYGNLIEIVSPLTNHWQPQLWFSGGASGNILHRNKEYKADSFGDWFTILDSRNYSGYVKKIGIVSVGSNVNPIYLNAGVPTKSSYSFGNASGNIPISNGTLSVNLNADLLDGLDSLRFFHGKNNRPSGLMSAVTGNGCYSTTGSLPDDAPDGAYGYGNFVIFDAEGSSANGGAITQIYFPHSGTSPCFRTTYARDANRYHNWYKLARTIDNVASATKLQNPRTINATSFDGTKNITTVQWGTTRNIGIVNSDGTGTAVTVPVNGGANVNLKLPSTIKASLNGNATTATTLQTARTIWGQSFDGTANVSGALTGVTNITASGSITAQKMYITGTANSNAYITAGTSYGMYFAANGLSLLSLDGSQKAVRSGSGYASQISLGTATVRWSNLYSVLGNFSGAVTIASTLAVTGALIAKGGVNFNGSQLTNVSRIEFQPGDAGRKTVITNGGSFLLYGSTGEWEAGLGYYGNDGTTKLGNAAGAYGSGNTLNYYYYGGTYSSPKMVLLPGGNFGIGTTAPSQKLHVAGNILATGSITAKSVSDLRLKTILTTTADYRHKLLSLGRIVDFYYNDKAIQRNTGAVDKEKHTGLIYQSAKELGLPNFCHTDDDGYGAINYLCTDYINLIAGALQQTIVAQETIEQRVERLERENEELRRKLNNLTAA